MKRLLQLPASRFLSPGSGFMPRVWVPAPWSGSCLQLPVSRPIDLSCLREEGNQLGQKGVSLDPKERGSISIHMTSLKKKGNILLSRDIMNIFKS